MIDSGPVGMVTNPKTTSAECQDCKLWLDALPLKTAITYLPITTEAMLLADQLWAEARRAGKPTADFKALDGDVILAAQAKLEENKGSEVIIATTNVGHLSQFVDAREWRLI